MKRSALVESWLSTRRYRELSIARSMEKWLETYPAELPDPRRSPLPAPPRRQRQFSPGSFDMRFSPEMLNEVELDAYRHDRTISATMQAAWVIAREKIFAYPGVL